LVVFSKRIANRHGGVVQRLVSRLQEKKEVLGLLHDGMFSDGFFLEVFEKEKKTSYICTSKLLKTLIGDTANSLYE
jgi:hypothetical protein